MDWYQGETLLEHLERIEAADVYEEAETGFSVQTLDPKQKHFTILEVMQGSYMEEI